MAEPENLQLEFEAPGHDIRFRANLMPVENPTIALKVWNALPLKSTLGHVVVSGEAIWTPTRFVHLEPGVMVERSPGAVYFYAPGQTICMTYGAITESSFVNKFAQVLDEDLPKLTRLGDIVWHHTVANARRQLVEFTIRRAA